MDLLSFLVLAALAGLAFSAWLTHRVLGYARGDVPVTAFREDLESPAAGDPGESLVILVPGTFCDARTLLPWRDRLEASGFRCWLFEYRYLDSMVQNARLLEALVAARLEALGERAPRRIQLVGYSQGGLLLRWLLRHHQRRGWLARVVGWIQVASPNTGVEPADLAVLLRGRGGEPAAPALDQIRRGSRLLERLDAGALPEGLAYGLVYGHGPGRAVLGRFRCGTPQGDLTSRVLGWFFELLFLCPRENDGLVSSESARHLVDRGRVVPTSPPRKVETDHLGLLVHEEVAEGLALLVGEALGEGGSRTRRG